MDRSRDADIRWWVVLGSAVLAAGCGLGWVALTRSGGLLAWGVGPGLGWIAFEQFWAGGRR